MNSTEIHYENTKIIVTPLEDGLFGVQFSTNKENKTQPEKQEFLVDTKYNCMLQGNMSNMLVHVLKHRREE